ncbi:MAG: hypothetical protein ACRDT8_03310 [Micromonosporaceae bacterium]
MGGSDEQGFSTSRWRRRVERLPVATAAPDSGVKVALFRSCRLGFACAHARRQGGVRAVRQDRHVGSAPAHRDPEACPERCGATGYPRTPALWIRHGKRPLRVGVDLDHGVNDAVTVGRLGPELPWLAVVHRRRPVATATISAKSAADPLVITCPLLRFVDVY